MPESFFYFGKCFPKFLTRIMKISDKNSERLQKHFNLPHEDEEQPEEMTEDEKAAMRHRCEITRAVYDITSVAILNYINIIVRGVHKDAQEQGATHEQK